MKKVFVALLSFSITVGILFSGCTPRSGNVLMSQIQSEGVLRVAVSKNDSPYSYNKGSDTEAEYDGIEVSIVSKIAEDMGVALEVVPVERENLITSVNNGVAHIAIGRLTDNIVVSNQLAPSISYLSGNIYSVTKRGNVLSTTGALSEKAAICANGVSEDTISNIYNAGNIELYPDDGSVEIVSALKEGLLDAYICYDLEALQMIKDSDLQAQVLTNVETENYVIATLQDNDQLVKLINQTLTNSLENDIINQIVVAYQK